MLEPTFAIGIVTALLHGSAFVIYSKQASDGSSKPNAASWLVWAILATMNAVSFWRIRGDAVATMQFFTGSVGCIATFFFALMLGKLKPLKPYEKAVVVISVAAGAVWYYFQSAAYANLVILVGFIVSFEPTYRGVRRDPSNESPLPWWLWTAAFALTTLNVWLREGVPVQYAVPVGGGLLHLSIAVLSRGKRKAAFLLKQ